MTWTALAAMSAIVVFAGFVQGSTGVGFALVVAPVLGLVAPQMLPVTVLILMLPLNIYVAWRERVALDFRSGAWVTAGRFAGTFAGLWVLVALATTVSTPEMLVIAEILIAVPSSAYFTALSSRLSRI